MISGVLHKRFDTFLTLICDGKGDTEYFFFQGTSTLPAHVLFIEPGFVPNSTLYVIQRKCIWDSHNTSRSSDAMPIQLGKRLFVSCLYEVVATSMKCFQP